MLRSAILPTGINLYVTGNKNQSIVIGEFVNGIQSSGANVIQMILGESINDTATKIKNATMFVAYVGDHTISPSLYIELGIAISHKKIIYIVCTTNSHSIMMLTLDTLQYKNINYVSNITIIS